jgi:DNA repair exonuclease SbcCD ATPase subunit
VRYILGLDLTNVVTFKKLSVDFDKNLTYVRGQNLDSDPVSPTGNGAGKTLMFSAIANLFYQSTPLALKKKAKKDILRQRGSAVGVIMKQSVDGPEYEIIQTSTGYKIYEDGKDLELRTIPLAEDFIHQLFPMSETKFYSTCYLSTQRPYILQRDTDSNRLQHITDIFNLDQYSGIREVLAVRLRTIKDDELKMAVLTQHLMGLKKKIGELSSDTTREEYLAAKKTYKSIVSEMESVQSSQFELATRQRDLETLLGIEKQLDDLRSTYTFKVRPAKMLTALKTQRNASLQWDRWQQRSQQSTLMLKKLDKKISACEVPDTDLERLEKKQTSYTKAIKKAEIEITDLVSAQKSKVKAEAILAKHQKAYDELGIKGKIPEGDLLSDLAVMRSTLRLEKLLAHGHEDHVECPTCFTALDLADIKQTVDAARKKVRQLEKFVDAQRLIGQIAEAEANIPEFDEERLTELRQFVAQRREALEEIEGQIEAVEAYNSLIEQRGEIEVPEEPDCERPEFSMSEIDEYLDLCSSIVEALSQKDLLLANHKDLAELRTAAQVSAELKKVSANLTKLETTISDLRTVQSDSASKITAYDQYKNTGTVYRKELADIQAKIDLLTPGLENKKLLEILLKAYGTKGLRATAADSVCKLLQTNLNHYRDLIFAEAFTFEVIASETGISILVDRNNGKPDSVSDARNLSGAESNSFQLLCLISLLPLLPDSERVNMVILDEPTSHMDKVSRSIFNERFVPVLREIVPSVYIISPHEDDVCQNSHEWIVQKRNGLSSLITS